MVDGFTSLTFTRAVGMLFAYVNDISRASAGGTLSRTTAPG